MSLPSLYAGGVVGPADVGLHRVGERVHAGGGGDLWRQLAGHLRVQDRVLRHQVQIHQRVFVMGIGIGDDGGDGGLRAGSGRGGHGDIGRDLLPHLQQARHLAHLGLRPHDPGGGRLGRVHGGTATDGDEALAAGVPIELLDPVDRVHRGIGLHLGKEGVGDTGLVQLRQDLRSQLPADGGAGDDHDLLYLLFFQQLRDLLHAADAGDRDRPAPVQAARSHVEDCLKPTVICFLDECHRNSSFVLFSAYTPKNSRNRRVCSSRGEERTHSASPCSTSLPS